MKTRELLQALRGAGVPASETRLRYLIRKGDLAPKKDVSGDALWSKGDLAKARRLLMPRPKAGRRRREGTSA